MLRTLFLLCLSTGLLACATTPTHTDDGSPYLGHLVARDHQVDIVSTDEGVRYTVVAADGTVIAENATEEALAAEHPELWEAIREAVTRKGETIHADVDPDAGAPAE